MFLSKRKKNINSNFDKFKEYTVSESIDILKKLHSVKFDESIDINVNLNVDPKKSDQNIRSTIILPNGNGKEKKILVIASDEKIKEIEGMKVDFFGSEDMIEKISSGWCDFDVVIATPDMMKNLGKVAKILGPKGLMPNPKSGTVTIDIKKAINEIRSGKTEFRVDSYGIIHLSVGRISFDKQKLMDNINKFLDFLIKIKPSTVKGSFIKSLSLTSTMGPGIKINLLSILDNK